MPTHTALRFNLRTNNSQNATGAESDKTSNSNQQTATNFNPSSDTRWVEDYSVNQSDDFSVQSVTGLGRKIMDFDLFFYFIFWLFFF